MTGLRYFGAYDASSVGIDTLHVACDVSLAGPDVLLRVTGVSNDGDVDFDHLALSVNYADLDAMTHALGRAIEDGELTETGRREAHQLLDRVRAARILTRNEARLRLMFRQVAQGERVQLADEGATTFEVSEYPPEVAVHRWGAQVVGGYAIDRAILTALYDLGLPRTVAQVPDQWASEGRPSTRGWMERAEASWLGIVKELAGRDPITFAGVTHTGGNCLAIRIEFDATDGDAYALLTAGPDVLTEDRMDHRGHPWRLGYYASTEATDADWTVTLDLTDAGDASRDEEAASRIAQLLFRGMAA
jgi:hypothetical protein